MIRLGRFFLLKQKILHRRQLLIEVGTSSDSLSKLSVQFFCIVPFLYNIIFKQRLSHPSNVRQKLKIKIINKIFIQLNK